MISKIPTSRFIWRFWVFWYG